MASSLGRNIPADCAGAYGLYEGPFAGQRQVKKASALVNPVNPNQSKMLESIEAAIEATGLKDGMTISFHHHFREGDFILNMVMEAIAKKGIKNLKLAPSSLGSVHKPLIEHIKNGVVKELTTSGLRGELAEFISLGGLEKPVIVRSHGGRARAVESGDIKIDVAFLGAPSSDALGNASGSRGRANCGSLGYAKVDAAFADQVVIITDCLVDAPNLPASIPQTQVDYVVVVDAIGDPKGIASGATRYTKNPKELLIAEYASKAIIGSEYFKDGLSFQTGTGGSSLAVSRFIKEEMLARGMKARFALGGITKPMVEMLEEGLINHIYDVQGFDLNAVDSIAANERHHEIDASHYANPHNKGCAANDLDIVVLSALEIDTAFNVNVMTGSDGVLRGASGGHSDTAACAKMTVIVTPLTRGRIPCVVEKVNTIITPGETVDVVITDLGAAVNPNRPELRAQIEAAGVPVYTIEALKEKAYSIVGTPDDIQYEDDVIAIIEYRDGSVIDVVRRLASV